MSIENIQTVIATATATDNQPDAPSVAHVNAFEEAMKNPGTLRPEQLLSVQNDMLDAAFKIDLTAKVAGQLTAAAKQLTSMQ
jgi:type III secretion system YscI/HrpB-like protein